MTISMYRASVPLFKQALTSLNSILDKASAYADARKIAPQVLLTARLAPDMLDFTKQVQIATDNAKGIAARLAGIEPPKMEDNEKSFPELKARIEKTLAFLETVEPSRIDGSETRDIALKLGPREVHFKGIDYLLTFGLQNFLFHVTTAYAILRHNGLDIGKADFIGGR
jgi:uncharacterized protein